MEQELIDEFFKLKIDNKPNKEKSKKGGEVFTPASLINEMLDKLPEEVWKEKNYKWFDPAAGCGQFLWEVYKRLIKNFDKEHIIKNMLYMSELYEENYKECIKIFGENANIYNVDTLKYDWSEKFDVIVGNPPYNLPNSKLTGNNIWHKFVWKAFDLLKEGGYLTFVHPQGWRKPESKYTKNKGIFNKMTKECKMMHLNIIEKSESLRIFNACVKVDWYVIKNEKPEKDFLTQVCDINDIYRMLDLKLWNWLPNGYYDEIYKLIDGDEKICIFFNNYNDPRKPHIKKEKVFHTEAKCLNTDKNNEFIYPVINTIPRTGPRFFYSNTKDLGFFDEPKVIFGLCHPLNSVIIDLEGKYGLSNMSAGIKVDNIDDANNIKRALQSSKFKRLLKEMIWGNFQIDWRLFRDFNKDFWKHL